MADASVRAGSAVTQDLQKLVAAIKQDNVVQTFREHLESIQPDLDGRLLVADVQATEEFAEEDSNLLGTTTSEIRVPVTYYYLSLIHILKWRHQFQFAGYYAAIEQGYYRDAGLAVTLREASTAHDPTEEVIEGRAEFGVGNSDLLLFRQKGYPVVVLADIFQHSPLVLVARTASGATDLQALHDKRLMMVPSESAELFAYFKYEGVDPSKLHVQPQTFNIEDFISGKVDAMSAYSTDEPFLLRQRGVPFYSFVPRAGGIDFYGDCLFTTETQIKDCLLYTSRCV